MSKPPVSHTTFRFSIPLLLMRLLMLCFCIIGGRAQGQSDFKFTHLTNLDGLSQSTVQAIIKDRFGFMWFGTQDGLNRYDGYTFKVYRHIPGDSTSLRKSQITSLYEDRQGVLWVGTNNGALSMYDRGRDAFIHFKETGSQQVLSQKTVTTIYEDRQNNLWVGTYWKLNLVDRKTGKITHVGNNPADPASLSNDGITSIIEDHRGQLWIGTNNGLNILDRKTKKARRFYHSGEPGSLSDNHIRSLYQDSRGRLWVGTNNGLNLYDYVTGTFNRIKNEAANSSSLGDNQVTSIQDAGNGKLWLGNGQYLVLFDPGQNHFTYIGSNPSIPTTLSKNGNVTALYRDKTGILWVGTYQGGINKLDGHLTLYDTYQNNPSDWNSLSFNVVTSLAESREGNIWVGTGGGGLNLWNRTTNAFTRFQPDPDNPRAIASFSVISLCLGKKNDYLWIGFYGSGMDRYDPKTNTFKHYTKGDGPYQLNNDAVYAIFEDSRGQVWMATNGGGVNVLNQETGVITKYVYDPNDSTSMGGNYVRCFFEDKKGNIWIGSSGGVSVFDLATKKFTNYNQGNTELYSEVIYAITQDRRENIWIGTLGGGLNRFNPSTGQLKTYTMKEGLPDNTINAIVEDHNGNLWISTNNGLSCFNPQSGTFKNSSYENGIQSFEFSMGAGLKTRNGDLVFGGINGLNVIKPNSLIRNMNVPPVAITGFRLFNKIVTANEPGTPLKQDILNTKEITLSHDQSIISFEFAALSFTAPEKSQYAYMLEGFDRDWYYSGSTRSATYTNLSPGTYTFRVKAANNDGIWNEEGKAIRLVITPPFWQTWWFTLLAVVLVIGGIFLLYQARVSAIHRQKLLLEVQVRERTESLAQKTRAERKARKEAAEANIELEQKNRELEQFAYVASHDMQEPLRTISSFVDLLHKQYKGQLDDRADKYLNFIVQASDRMKVLICDLLEYSRIGKKTVLSRVDCNDLLKEIQADLLIALSESKAAITVEPLPTIQAYPTEIKQLFQNLITNAIKFRNKDTPPIVQITAKKLRGKWQFTVSDNGIGIDPKHNERIFAIFQRLHTRSEFEGSGIGLSNCKKIAELHGGKIWVESEVGRGSHFHFTVRDASELPGLVLLEEEHFAV